MMRGNNLLCKLTSETKNEFKTILKQMDIQIQTFTKK